jgi:Fuc2NAc and GlcNAc transferase
MTMNALIIILFGAGCFLVSVVFTGYIRRYAMRHAVLDVPNTRSLHNVPTPRGGGLSIAITLMLACILVYSMQLLSLPAFLALFGGGLGVTLVGWLDDRYHISVGWRALDYLLASVWAVYWLDSTALVRLDDTLYFSIFGGAISVLIIAWLTNLYNFMDGTDALAAVQAICTGMMAGMLLNSSGQPGLAVLCLVITTSSAGFVIWNWPPARIFMGDAGSCLLGYSFGVLAIMSAGSDSTVSLAVWFILLAVFVCDATLTLLMRMMKGEKFYSAHRDHAYQRIVQMGFSHAAVARGVLCINVVILWPAAYVAYSRAELSFMTVSAITFLMCLLWGGIQLNYYHRSGS